MVGILLTFWDCLFSGAMLVAGRVLHIPVGAKNPEDVNVDHYCWIDTTMEIIILLQYKKRTPSLPW